MAIKELGNRKQDDCWKVVGDESEPERSPQGGGHDAAADGGLAGKEGI